MNTSVFSHLPNNYRALVALPLGHSLDLYLAAFGNLRQLHYPMTIRLSCPDLYAHTLLPLSNSPSGYQSFIFKNIIIIAIITNTISCVLGRC